jgi:hypothetical protein
MEQRYHTLSLSLSSLRHGRLSFLGPCVNMRIVFSDYVNFLPFLKTVALDILLLFVYQVTSMYLFSVSHTQQHENVYFTDD